jgi:hypothetical protein
VSAPSTGDLLALLTKWAGFEGVSSNPGDTEDDAFANGTEWGHRMASRDLATLLTSYGEEVPARRDLLAKQPEPMVPIELPRAIPNVQPIAPEGWKLIAPSEAKPGDGVYRVGFGVALLGPMMFDPIPIEARCQLWAVRRAEG